MDNTSNAGESTPMTSSTILQECNSGTKQNINGSSLETIKVNGNESSQSPQTEENIANSFVQESQEENLRVVNELVDEEDQRSNLKRKYSSDSDGDLADGGVFKALKKRLLKPSISSLLDTNLLDVRLNKEIPTIDDMILSKIQDNPNNKLDAESLANPLHLRNINLLKNNPALLKKLAKSSNGDNQLEYAQYLGLQPSVKFKCFRCSEDSFPNYNVLKEHQKRCLLERRIVPHTPIPSSSNSSQSTNFRITRKVYLCSACGTYYENWNLFLHMRTVHKRYICLFCLGMFSYAQKLSSHLESKHNVIEKKFTDDNDLMKTYSGSCFFMCCTCEHVFTERDNFSDHCCSDFQKPCVFCGLTGSHKKNCKAAPKPKTNGSNGKTAGLNKTSKVAKTAVNKGLGKPKVILGPEAHVTGDSMPPVIDNCNKVNDEEQNFNPAALCVVDMADNAMQNDISSVDNSTASNKMQENVESSTLNLIPDISCVNNSVMGSIKDNLENVNTEITEENSYPEISSDLGSPRDNIEQDSNNENSNETVLNNDDSVKIPSNYDQNISDTNSQVLENDESKNTEADETSDVSDLIPNEHESEKLNDNANSIESNVDQEDIEMENNANDTTRNETTLSDIVENAQSSNESGNDVDVDVTNSPDKLESLKTTIKVPKLTVKLPKTFNNMPFNSSSESESDVEKLTMDDDDDSQNNTSTENIHETIADKQSDLNSEEENIFDASGKTNSDHDNSQETVNENDGLINIDNANNDTDEIKSTNLDTNITIAGEDVTIFELTLDQPLHKLPVIELFKKFLAITVNSCLYCNHVRKIAINGKQIGLHLIAQHRFRATVESITAEELLPETIVSKITQSLPELEDVYFNLENYDSTDKSLFVPYDGYHECFRCRFVTKVHKELYLHNRKCHQKAIVLCTMCKSTFYTYSELLCHFCPGTYEQNITRELLYRCCLCDLDNLPSAFRLMVHLRKRHHTCDVCLEQCGDQSRLSNHVWKHKLQHLCYRCGISYRNKPDITKHLFWKHGTESVLCKRCLQKKWPHVYHFCILPSSFVCEECGLSFTKAVALKVHKRLHNDYRPYPCADCEQQFVSKKLLLKHAAMHSIEPQSSVVPVNNIDESKSDVKTDSVDPSKTSEEMKTHKTKKNKKNDKNKESLDDVVADLPALNLSESDSSDESEGEVKNTTLKTNSETMSIDVAEDEMNPAPVVLGIWDNFKTYQASIDKTDDTENLVKQDPIPVLHVCQSDHDYLDLEQVSQGDASSQKAEEKLERREEETLLNSSTNVPNSPVKKSAKTPKHRNRESSSSSDSSSSNSSCSCGENCSCSSSSSSSSNSSDSSSDSDSSSSEGKRRIQARKERRASRALQKKQAENQTQDAPNTQVQSNPPELPIYESDLDTDESETDEDFYDEHPQRLANKLLAEKRNQLIMLASLASTQDSRNGLTLDMSRTSTPSLPPDEVQPLVIKKVKTKKRKKEKKSRVVNSPPPPQPMSPMVVNSVVPPLSLKLNIPKNPDYVNHQSEPPVKITISRPVTPEIAPLPMVPPLPVKPQQISSNQRTSIDDSKRASKRRRIPNKFYGYSSDEEAGLLKPQAPPQLTWRKEDLPEQPPKIIEPPPRVPPLPVHQMLAQQQVSLARPISDASDNGKSSQSDDSSSDEGALHISQPPIPVPAAIPRSAPAVVRQAREGESVYCYCRCPYDEVSEMIACDGTACAIEWFHFECVGIMVPPKGKWFCPECRQKQHPPPRPGPDFFC